MWHTLYTGAYSALESILYTLRGVLYTLYQGAYPLLGGVPYAGGVLYTRGHSLHSGAYCTLGTVV